MPVLKNLPVLPLRDIVVFPDMVAPLFVGRDKSVRALEMIDEGDNEIMLVAQRDAAIDDPGADDVHEIGTVATILQLLKLPDGTVKVLVEGQTRARLQKLHDRGDYFEAEVETIPESDSDGGDVQALMRAVQEQFENYVKLNRKIPPESVTTIGQLTEPGKLADAVASQLSVKISDKQELLELSDIKDRLEKVFALMEGEMGRTGTEDRRHAVHRGSPRQGRSRGQETAPDVADVCGIHRRAQLSRLAPVPAMGQAQGYPDRPRESREAAQ